MKLNLGCGFNKKDGYINVDKYDSCQPDLAIDLEVTPWPFRTSEIDEVLFNHSLEHMGEETVTFLAIVKELHRVCKPGATVQINVPHPRHDNFIGDPTHVRIITPQLLSIFSKKLNHQWIEMGAANTPLAIYLDVDFEVRHVTQLVEQKYLTLVQEGKISDEDLALMMNERNNVVSDYQITLEVIK